MDYETVPIRVVSADPFIALNNSVKDHYPSQFAHLHNDTCCALSQEALEALKSKKRSVATKIIVDAQFFPYMRLSRNVC